MLVLAVTAALASAGAYAAGAVSQRRLALGGRPLTPWRAAPALGLNLLGAGLHVLALRWGPLTLVQALGAVALVLALPASARLVGRRVTAAEWRAAAMVVVGLDVVVVAARTSGASRALTGAEAGGLVAGVVALVVVLVLLARAVGTRGSGILLAVAAGTTSAVASALTQTADHRITSAGVADPGVLLVLTGIAVLALAGLLLSQLAYRGDLGAPLATSTLTNAAVAAALGTVVLGERIGSGRAELSLAAAAALVAGWGVVLLTRSPPSSSPLTSGPSRCPPGAIVLRLSQPQRWLRRSLPARIASCAPVATPVQSDKRFSPATAHRQTRTRRSNRSTQGVGGQTTGGAARAMRRLVRSGRVPPR